MCIYKYISLRYTCIYFIYSHLIRSPLPLRGQCWPSQAALCEKLHSTARENEYSIEVWHFLERFLVTIGVHSKVGILFGGSPLIPWGPALAPPESIFVKHRFPKTKDGTAARQFFDHVGHFGIPVKGEIFSVEEGPLHPCYIGVWEITGLQKLKTLPQLGYCGCISLSL